MVLDAVLMATAAFAIQYRTENPIALAKPIEVKRNYARVTDLSRMIDENECEDNDRDPVVNGRFITTVH